ncbi:hypothetical protein TCAL_02125 [Tigriopus californicus]|uniref:LRRCT domain-containing protein n=1 Tax=Tigriopus californicus TaxID=6832 RepID=A0A553N8B9_TIGCA|nr:hypothetical protein TCAL_02125 [Tigriopus californicus]|eukprot:TCALIF_02125-PA protein Name:"Similar to SLIT3 Slit homolog 3 protein (Homo sapiens)" AED:0.97 eAED:0.97 QI:0/0/0/0.25/1/1/4/0/944
MLADLISTKCVEEMLSYVCRSTLNDNNICRIRANAFKDAQSLNSISLSNNRLTRIYEQSFGENNYRISRMEIAGNPLTCDCNTLWLRNLASDTNVVPDEPRCYFPRALSGKPLRQLRTSRFTCDSRAGENLIKDACSGIPLKRPIQEAIQEQTTQQNVVTRELPRSSRSEDINLEDNVSNDKVAGDTPTIYAEIKDPEDGEKSDEDDSVFSIFGIPIPKLPLNLNFALSPALSSGLLPIGRKGDNANQAPDTSSSNKAPTNQIVPPEVDQTRGPDFLDPIWVETGLKAAGFLLPKLAESFANRGTSSSSNGAATEKRQVSKSGNSENNEMFNYQHPTNPIIPLRSGSTSNQENPRYFPQDGTNEEYFPKGYIPAIQYNHPVPNGYPLPMSGHTPIHAHPNDQVSLPSNDDFNSAVPKQNIPRQTIGQRPSSGANLGFGSSQDDVNGFKPLFRPHTKDPMFSPNQGQLQPGSSFQSAFPELDSPMTPLPPGFKVADASDLTDTSNKYPHLNHPSLQFTSPANNEVSSSESTSFTPISTSTLQPNNLGPSYQAVPGSFPDSSSIDRPPILNPGPLLTNLFASTNEDTSSTTLSDILEGQVKSDPNPDYEYEYVYEDVVPETKASSPIASLPGFNPPSDHVEGQAEIQRLLEEFRRQNVEEREVTERVIPTLQVQEVTTSSSNEVSTEGVEIAHRGTPKIVPETTTFNLIETEPDYTTTSSEYFDEPKDDEPEYQYYYEYYDDEEDPASTTEGLTTSSEQPGDNILAQPQQSLDDIFNLMKQKGDFDQNSPQSKNFERPTPPPPIRTSTQLYDVNGNYLESQRSSVTVDSVSASRIQAPEVPDLDEPKSSTLSSLDGSVTRRSSSPYPFHPDRSDPASKPNRDDQPGWYYSNYNKDNVEPFRGPGADDMQHNGSSSSRLHCLNSAPLTLISTVLLVLAPRIWGTWHV